MTVTSLSTDNVMGSSPTSGRHFLRFEFISRLNFIDIKKRDIKPANIMFINERSCWIRVFVAIVNVINFGTFD